jgi:hypothetical protein
VTIPDLPKGDEYRVKPDAKSKNPGKLRFSPLEKLAEELPRADHPAFVRNIVNRLWFLMMGRGLVHPLDQHHTGNPPSHPEVLDLLAKEFVAHRMDIKWLLRELALSQTYQRSSLLPEGQTENLPTSFLTALEKRLSAEQMLQAVMVATGSQSPPSDAIRKKFLQAFANPVREPEDEITPSLKASLFLLNDASITEWLKPQPGNLTDRLVRKSNSKEVAEELYLSVLSRRPDEDESQELVRYLDRHPTGEARLHAITQQVAALLASVEFTVNH